jgi:hypothetical protein
MQGLIAVSRAGRRMRLVNGDAIVTAAGLQEMEIGG